MSDQGGDIIIKGGSAEIQFDPDLFQKDPGDPKKHRHHDLKIKRVIITGDDHFKDFDSGEHPGGFKGTIRVICK